MASLSDNALNRPSSSVVPHIETERCVVRLGSLSDVPRILTYHIANAERFSPPVPDSLLNEESWIEWVLKTYGMFLEDSAYKLFVFDRDETRVLGTVLFSNIRRDVRHDCTLGYTVDADHEGQGYMFESVTAAIEWAFTERSLHRIEAIYVPDNAPSARLLQRLGFDMRGSESGPC